ncbi:HAD family hydrolase [bacterium]|nr:HAD family hydrolase [bacterium]
MADGLVLLDIDGTLVLTGYAGVLAFERTAAALYGGSGGEVDFAGNLDDLNATAWIAAAGGTPDAAALAEFRRGVAERLPAALAERAGQGRCLPGVVALLDALDARGVPFGLLTGNWEETGRMKLAHYGLEGRFAWGAWGDDGEARADLVPVALARARAAGWSGEGPVWVVGDTHRDIAAARAHGILAAGVLTGPPPTHEPLRAAAPDLLLESLADTGAVLEGLFG